MKKILFLHGSLGGGGAERVLIDLLTNLDHTKYDVDLCLIINQGIMLPEVPKQVTIIPLWQKYTFYYKIALRMSIWFKNNMLFKRILQQKLTKKYDVEISFLEGMPLKLHALMATTAKKITWVHCDLLNFPYQASLFADNEELQSYNKMDVVAHVSNDSKMAFEKRFPTCTTRSAVVYNPIDCKKISILASAIVLPKNKTFTIVTVGRLTMPKKIDRVIRLAARLKKEKYAVAFQIIGDGELKNELQQLTIDLNVTDCVAFLGFLKNPYPYIKNADVLLLPSGYEGFGLVVCEAMVLGVPVVSTKTAGPTEIIHNNVYGLLCNHDDTSIYLAVKQMIDNDMLRNRYKKVGYQRAAAFDIENTVRAFDQLIVEL